MEKEVKKFIEETQKIRMSGEEKSSIRKNILNNIGAPASPAVDASSTSFFGGLNFMAFSAIILLLVVGGSYSSIKNRNDEGILALKQDAELLPMASERFATDNTSIESDVQLEGGESEATSINVSDLPNGTGGGIEEENPVVGISVEPVESDSGNSSDTSKEIFKMVDNHNDLEKYLEVAGKNLEEVFPNGI